MDKYLPYLLSTGVILVTWIVTAMNAHKMARKETVDELEKQVDDFRGEIKDMKSELAECKRRCEDCEEEKLRLMRLLLTKKEG